MLKSTLQKKPGDCNRIRVRNQTDHRTTSRNPSPTNQAHRALLAEFNCRSYACRGLMACPGLRRTRIGITDIPGMRIGARTVTPVTMVPSRHLSERQRSPHPNSSEHRRPSSSSGQERNSKSRAATPTDSRRHNLMGQQGSSRWSRAEGRDSGSTA